MENENMKDLLPEEDSAKDILPEENTPAPEAEILPEETVTAEQAEILPEEAPAVEETISDLDARIEATMASMEGTQSLPNLKTGLDTDAEFQEALEALKAFSSRYKSPDELSAQEETPAEDVAPAESEDAVQEEIAASVTEDTVSFVPPAVTPAENLEATQQFAPVESAEEVLADVPQRKRPPVRKGRPSAKKGYGLLGLPHVVSTAIWLAIIVTIGISLGRILWVCASDLLAFGKPDKAVTITVEETDTIESIADKLEQSGLIRYKNLFLQFAKLTGKGNKIIPGTYTLNTKYDYNALLKMMSFVPVSTEVVKILIPEGYNCAQIFKLLEEKGVCSAADLEEYAANGELNEYWFLEGVPRGTKYCLEGYLYPDTYQFYKDDSPRRVLQKFLNAFKFRFTDKMYNDFLAMQKRFDKMLKANGYGTSYREKHKLTFHKLITMASIVEEEKATSAEGYDIAAVFYNRLAKPAYFPRLDSDATVHYAIGSYLERHELSSKDLAIDSPYNTRKYGGLPPGPITNPGSYSLYAALYPSESGYYYFIYDATAGFHRFSLTLEEHERWAVYLEQLQQQKPK